MPEFNQIKQKQIDSDVWSFVSGLVSGEFPVLMSNYLTTGGGLGDLVVYRTDIDQTISGQKSFFLSPSVPYSGETGQVVSRRYIDDEVTEVWNSLNPLVNSSFVYRTGDQVVSGVKLFTGDYLGARYLSRIGFGNTNFGINLDTSALIDSGGSQSLNWANRSFVGDWSFDENPFIEGSKVVLTSQDQTISGLKVFTGEVKVPLASNRDNPATFGQLTDQINATGKQLSDLLLTAATGTSSGFAGVLSFNGASGNIFSQGRGTVTCWQQGNIFNVSGANIYSGVAQALFGVNSYNIPTGYSEYRIQFGQTYSQPPFVFTQIGNSDNQPELVYQISGVNTSGFGIAISDEVSSSGYFLNYILIDQTGFLSLLKGEQGILGPYLKPKGLWQTGTSYAYLDFAYLDNGTSFVSKTGHLSTTGTNPTGASGNFYWSLLASGQGTRGSNGIIFGYAGEWDQSREYVSGEAVTYAGSSYATISGVDIGFSPTGGAPWFIVAPKGGEGLVYRGEFDFNTEYTLSNGVSFNNANYLYTGLDVLSGILDNPISLKTKWTQLTNRSITHNGRYLADKIYYPNDLTYTPTGLNIIESIQYINTAEDPLLSFHPKGYYNIFTDCDGFSGYSLFQLTTGLKNEHHPNFGIGSDFGFAINNVQINESSSGWGTLTLIRGEAYYFDSELSDSPFIFTTNPTGGNYSGQIIENVFTGSRLVVSSAGYEPMGYDEAIYSGTARFIPSSIHPDVFYYQSPINQYMGWKIKLVDKNPWEVFSSGIKGDSGISGLRGLQGSGGLAFIWRGEWNVLNGYLSGDSIYYDGSSYATNQNVLGTQPGNLPWFLVAKGGQDGQDSTGLAFRWRGTWSPTIAYAPYDSVYYGGSSYGTTGAPSGNFPPDITTQSWFLVAKKGATGERGLQGSGGLAFVWRGAYSSITQYNSGDAIYYQGSSYGILTGSSGIPPDAEIHDWQIIARGGGVLLNWRGTWLPNETYYANDGVYHEGSSYGLEANTFSYNNNPISGWPWFVVAKGSDVPGPTGERGLQGSGGLAFVWKGTWNANSEYAPNESVFYNGSSYGTLEAISGDTKGTLPELSSKWFLIAKRGDPGLAFKWRGTWNQNNFYHPYDSVYFSGRSYATLNYVATGNSPQNYPWFVTAEMGGTALDESFFISGSIPTGYNLCDKFVSKPYLFTGYAVGLVTPGSGGVTVSGNIYRKNVFGSKFNLAPFILEADDVVRVSGGFAENLQRMDRIGFDILTGNLSGAEGFTLGVFGMGASD